jgi:hypothetical protein
LVLIVVLPITVLLVTATLVGPNALRPLLARVSEQYTGLPTEIGSLRWSLGLRPVVVAEGIRIGDAQFSGEVLRATATLDLTGLLRGVVVIDRIQVEDAYFQGPESPRELIDRIDGIVDAVNLAEQRPPGQQRPPASPRTGARRDPVVIRLIEVADVTARMGARDAFAGRVALRDVTSALLQVEVDGALPYFAPDATLTAAVAVGTEGPVSLEGTLQAQELDLNALDTTDNVPHARLDFEAAASGTFAEGVAITLTGAVDENEDHALDGPIQGEAILTADAFDVTAFTWDSVGFNCNGKGRFGFDGSVALDMPTLTMGHEAVEVLAALFPVQDYALVPANEAAVDVQDLVIDLPVGNAPNFERGTITLAGLSVTRADGELFLPNLRGRAAVEAGVLQIQELSTDHLQIAGQVAPDRAAGATRVDLTATARLDKAALLPFLDLSAVDRLSGTVTVSAFQGTFGATGGVPADLQFTAAITDVSVATTAEENTPALEATLTGGTFRMGDGVLAVEGVRGSGLAVDGTVTPDFVNGAYAVALSGSVDLSSALVPVFVPRGLVRDLRGTLQLEEASATIKPAEGIPTDLVLSGTLKDAGGTFTLNGVEETLRAGNGTFRTEPGQLHFDVTATGATMGPLAFSGNYDLGTANLIGNATVTIAQAAAPFLPEGEWRESGQAMLSAYGAADLEVRVAFPSARRSGILIEAHKTTEPTIIAAVTLDAGQLGAVQVETRVPMDGLNGTTAANMQFTGPAAISFTHDPKTKAFKNTVDLSEVEFDYAPYLKKSNTQALTVLTEGRSGPDAWAIASVSIQVLEQSLALRADEAGILRAEDARIDLAAWSPLLQEGRSVSGSLGGNLAIAPLALALHLDNVGIVLAPDAALTGISGGVHYQDGTLQLENLRVAGTDSDFRVNATYTGQQIDAAITGAALNLNALEALRIAVQPLITGEAVAALETEAPVEEPVPDVLEAPVVEEGAPDNAPPTPPPPAAPVEIKLALEGRATVDVGQLRYQRGYVDQFKANFQFRDGGVAVEDLHFLPYAGRVSGSAMLYSAVAGAPARMALRLRLDGADVETLGDMVPGRPLGLRGKYTGDIDVSFPLGNAVVACGGLDGLIDLQAEQGSFGKFGFATKLLSVMRATEVLRLRLPPTSDEGVAFETFTTRLVAQEGVVEVQDANLTSTAYNLTAKGNINFPANQMRLHVATNPLELVTGVASNVPLLGRGVDRILEGRGVQIRVTGSPWDPRMAIEVTPKIIRDVGGVLRGTVGGVGPPFGGGRNGNDE